MLDLVHEEDACAAPASLSSQNHAAQRPRLVAKRPYHHGDLRRVLVEAALQLVEEGGADAVSVREAARRAGVSPGAPFRHFPSRNALMNASQRRRKPASAPRSTAHWRRHRPLIRSPASVRWD